MVPDRHKLVLIVTRRIIHHSIVFLILAGDASNQPLKARPELTREKVKKGSSPIFTQPLYATSSGKIGLDAFTLVPVPKPRVRKPFCLGRGLRFHVQSCNTGDCWLRTNTPIPSTGSGGRADTPRI